MASHRNFWVFGAPLTVTAGGRWQHREAEHPLLVLENSLWTTAFALVALVLIRLAASFHGIARWIIVVTAAGAAGYVMFMVTIDVPMYLQLPSYRVRHPLFKPAGRRAVAVMIRPAP